MPVVMCLLTLGLHVLHVLEIMDLPMCPGLHVPLCTQSCVLFCVFKATCTLCLLVCLACTSTMHLGRHVHLCLGSVHLALPVVLPAKLRGRIQLCSSGMGSNSF